MNFSKYSKVEFEKRGRDSDEVRSLTDEMEVEVSRELHVVVLKRMNEIVQKLNSEGHKLELIDCAELGGISFIDQPTSDHLVQLRLGCDIVISAGFAHMHDDTRSIEEIEEETIGAIKNIFQDFKRDGES